MSRTALDLEQRRSPTVRLGGSKKLLDFVARYRHMMVEYGLLGRVVEPSPLWLFQPAGADGVVLV